MELVAESDWTTKAQAAAAVREYIDGFYNPVRRHTTIGSRSPIEFERLHASEQRESGGGAPAPPQKRKGPKEDGSGRRAA